MTPLNKYLFLLYDNGTANAVPLALAQLGKAVDELHGCCDRAGSNGIVDDLVSVVFAGAGDEGTR